MSQTISRKDYMKVYYEKNKDKWKENGKFKATWIKPYGYHLQYDQTLKGILSRIRSEARRRKLECSIDLSDLIMPETCPVLGIPLKFRTEVGKSTADPFAPSVDRIDNSKGYVKGNVRIISYRANVLKNDMTKEEAKLLYENFDAI